MGPWRLSLLLLLLLLTAPAIAATTLDVQAGYDNRFRPGRWSPVIVTVSHDKPITARLDVRAANASSSVMQIRQSIGVGPQKQTYIVYAPLTMLYDPVRVTLSDAATGKRLAEWPEDNPGSVNTRFGLGGEQVGFFAVTAGAAPVMQGIVYDRGRGTTIISHQPLRYLPTTPIGYDSIDLLYLNDPSWNALTSEQQTAIVTWVRSGGQVVLWPGIGPVQEDAPLAQVLPCKLGEVRPLELDESVLRKFRLPARFAGMSQRTLAPLPGSRTIPLLDGHTHAVSRRVGLGSITVMPIDAATLQFNDGDQFRRFWQTFLRQVVDHLPPEPKETEKKKTSSDLSFYRTADEVQAAHAALGRIGDIDDAGSFGFSYIAIVIGLLMLVVGPIDFFVLKKIGRQPWTWATTLGWIGLVTIGALYAGYLLRSGELHYRTLRLVEQADDQVVSQSEIALIYAPRSAIYAIEPDPTSWWQPVPVGDRYGNRADRFTLPMVLHQDYRGTRPEPMWIDVWNWRFLVGKRFDAAPPMISGNLKRNGTTLTGTLVNHTPHTLKQLRLHFGQNAIDLPQECPPGSSVTLEANIVSQQVNKAAAQSADTEDDGVSWKPERYPAYFALHSTETEAIGRLNKDNTVVICATLDDADPLTPITDPNARQQHVTMLRAVIELQP